LDKQYNNKEIENVLRRYPRIKAKAEIKRKELKDLFPACTANYDGIGVQTNKISDTTATFGIKRADNSETQLQVDIIELFLKSLSARQFKFIELYYFRKYYPEEVMSHLHIGRRTFWRIRDDILAEFIEIVL